MPKMRARGLTYVLSSSSALVKRRAPSVTFWKSRRNWRKSDVAVSIVAACQGLGPIQAVEGQVCMIDEVDDDG